MWSKEKKLNSIASCCHEIIVEKKAKGQQKGCNSFELKPVVETTISFRCKEQNREYLKFGKNKLPIKLFTVCVAKGHSHNLRGVDMSHTSNNGINISNHQLIH